MAINAFQRSKMTEKNPNTCRDIITNNDPPNSQLSYVFRIRIPKLLAKSMQRRSDGCTTAHSDHDHTQAEEERVINPKKLIPEKVGHFFSSVFGKKKSPKASSKVHKNGDGNQSDLADADDDGDQPSGFAPKSSSPLLEIEEEEEEEDKKPTMDRREHKPAGGAADKYLNVSFPYLSFLSKYTSLNFFRGKTKTGNECNHTRCNSNANSDETTDHTLLRRQGTDHNLPIGVAMSNTLTGRQESSNNSLLRNQSRVLRTHWKLKMASFLGKTTMRQIRGKSEHVRDERRKECGEELCKKRILMGEKCKPLNFSGSLHYDEDGILLPEVW